MNYKGVDAKEKVPIMRERKNNKDDRMAKIEKRPKDAAPGDIDCTYQWKKINCRRNETEGLKISTFKREIFTDTYRK